MQGTTEATPQMRAAINDGAILALWRLKHDTFEIAGRLRMRESDVANRLAVLRDRGAL